MELEHITAMSTVASKHVTAESKCGNTVSILLHPSMATVMGALLHTKLACVENSGSNFNPQFRKRSNFNPQIHMHSNFNPQFNKCSNFNPQFNKLSNFNLQINMHSNFNPQFNNCSNFNLQFNNCSNSWWKQSYCMINVPSSETQ